MVKLQKRLIENIIKDIIVKEEYCGILTPTNIRMYDIVINLKDELTSKDIESEILYDNEIKIKDGIYKVKQYKSGVVVFGFKESNTDKWWSSNPLSIYENTGVEVIGIKVENSAVGYYSMLISDLLAILPKDYVIVRDKTNCTYANIIRKQDLDIAEKAGYNRILPSKDSIINVDKICYIQNIYSKTTGLIKSNFDLDVFRNKLTKEQDFPNILNYFMYCKNNDVEIECDDEEPIFAGVISNGLFYSIKRLRKENLYVSSNDSILNYKDLMKLAKDSILESMNIVEPDKNKTIYHVRKSYMYMICKRGFDNIKVRVPVITKDYSMKIKDEFK